MEISGNKDPSEVCIEYNGILQGQTRAVMAQEIIKYFLFQLCQIPANCENLLEEICGELPVSDNKYYVMYVAKKKLYPMFVSVRECACVRMCV